MPAPLARSYLFVPANRPERFDKAYGAGADAVIVDLEDAVPEAEKATARAALANWLSADKPVLIRINHAESTWFADDLEVCRMDGCAGVVLPKAERVEHIAQVAERTGVGRVVIPLLETAQGLYDAVALARAPRVERLAFGSIDFQVDLGIRGENEELRSFPLAPRCWPPGSAACARRSTASPRRLMTRAAARRGTARAASDSAPSSASYIRSNCRW